MADHNKACCFSVLFCRSAEYAETVNLPETQFCACCGSQPLSVAMALPTDLSSVKTVIRLQRQREQKEVERRLRFCPRADFERMEKALHGQSKSKLVQFGLTWASQANCQPPDRLCRRRRQALICWFCQRLSMRVQQSFDNTVEFDPLDYDIDDFLDED
jgi:hypothetical protein